MTAGDPAAEPTASGISAISAIGAAKNVAVTVATNPSEIAAQFTAAKLADYRAVVFLDTATTDLLTDAEQTAFESYFRSGGGFMGIGSAIETEPGWQFYTDIIGARTSTPLAAAVSAGDTNVKVVAVSGFTAGNTISIDSGASSESVTIASVGSAGTLGSGITLTAPLTHPHAIGSLVALPRAPVQSATIKVADRVHDATKALPEYWDRTDAWYNFTTDVRGVSHVLATVVEDPFGPQPQGQVLDGIVGGTMGADHPFAWCKDYKGGRSFYTAGGNTAASFDETDFRHHLEGAIDWTAGQSDPHYSDCGATVLDQLSSRSRSALRPTWASRSASTSSPTDGSSRPTVAATSSSTTRRPVRRGHSPASRSTPTARTGSTAPGSTTISRPTIGSTSTTPRSSRTTSSTPTARSTRTISARCRS